MNSFLALDWICAVYLPSALGVGVVGVGRKVGYFDFFIDIGCGTSYYWNLRQKRSREFFEILNDEKKSHSESLIDWIEEPDTNVCSYCLVQFTMESLILAQDERWRRA